MSQRAQPDSREPDASVGIKLEVEPFFGGRGAGNLRDVSRMATATSDNFDARDKTDRDIPERRAGLTKRSFPGGNVDATDIAGVCARAKYISGPIAEGKILDVVSETRSANGLGGRPSCTLFSRLIAVVPGSAMVELFAGDSQRLGTRQMFT